MRQGVLDSLLFQLQASSSENTTCNTPILWAWTVRNQWLLALLLLSILWGRREKLKQCQTSQDSLVLWRSLNWLNGWGRENIFWWRLLVGAKIAKVQRKAVLVGIVRMVFWISKGRIWRWKLTEVEEKIFVWDYRGDCMHKQDFENEGAPNILHTWCWR